MELDEPRFLSAALVDGCAPNGATRSLPSALERLTNCYALLGLQSAQSPLHWLS